ESSAVAMLRASGLGTLVTMPEGGLPAVEDLVQALRAILAARGTGPGRPTGPAFDAWSARESARRLAEALDRALAGETRLEQARLK
ncbi:MAG: hypothetical protein R3349_03565, partial [Geminicoccaceae bacterium]|nr:hypothetical protein [Geminicoccaceae bacterium]